MWVPTDPPGPRGWSLRSRLLAYSLTASMLAWLLGALAVYWVAEHNSARLFDEHLRDMATIVSEFAAHEVDEVRRDNERTPPDPDLAIDSRYRFQIWALQGELLARNASAPPRTPLAPLTMSGLSTQQDGEHGYRVYSTRAARDTMIVQVAEPLAARSEFLVEVGWWFGAFLGATALALAAFNIVVIGQALRAIETTQHHLASRSPLDTAPVKVDAPPDEMVPLLDALNALLDRFGRAMSLERSFTSSAAHELRTPLAAMRAQAQLALRARAPETAARALRDLMQGVDRAARCIDQLLTMARLDATTTGLGAMPFERVDLVALIDAVVKAHRPALDAKAMHVALDLRPLTLAGNAMVLEMMVRNLVDNAIKYGPTGGRLGLSTAVDHAMCLLIVDDDGPGIAPQEIPRIFDRFYRIDHRVEGIGLGLAIVAEAVALHRGTLRLEVSPLGGLRVSVSLPLLIDADG